MSTTIKSEPVLLPNKLTRFWLLTCWMTRRLGMFIPLAIVVEMGIAIGAVLGFGLLVGDPDPLTALYLSTGAPILIIITVGLVMVPQVVGDEKTEGSFQWMRTLPLPRWHFLAVNLMLFAFMALPGLAIGMITAALRFDVTYSFAAWLPLALAAGLLLPSAIGYAIGMVLPPSIAQLLSQMLVFFVLLFSPISFPASRLPQWFQSVHDFLPIAPLANLIRSGLASTSFTVSSQDLVVLCVWLLASLGAAIWAINRKA